jgi:hypothetical protein
MKWNYFTLLLNKALISLIILIIVQREIVLSNICEHEDTKVSFSSFHRTSSLISLSYFSLWPHRREPPTQHVSVNKGPLSGDFKSKEVYIIYPLILLYLSINSNFENELTLKLRFFGYVVHHQTTHNNQYLSPLQNSIKKKRPDLIFRPPLCHKSLSPCQKVSWLWFVCYPANFFSFICFLDFLLIFFRSGKTIFNKEQQFLFDESHKLNFYSAFFFISFKILFFFLHFFKNYYCNVFLFKI